MRWKRCFGKVLRHENASTGTSENLKDTQGKTGTARIKSSSFNHTEAKQNKLRTFVMESGEDQ